MEIVQRIQKWNEDRFLHTSPFSLPRETNFIVEELLEASGYDTIIQDKDLRKQTTSRISREILDWYPTEPIDVADAFADIAIFAIGALTKLHHKFGTPLPNDILNKVMDHNDAKPSLTDTQGKIIKPLDFQHPTYDTHPDSTEA